MRKSLSGTLILAGMVILHEVPSGREAIGCILMFTAIIITQLPERVSKQING